ncbi:uncharacterized protein LOC135689042 [Rhopilema esculentum]|uniref:uncharacterized protein LOC135689042 n=1 Tax=Rhopilema esculentum TaxID=499914 RepID=UPI0031DF9D77|eukprot:gene7742-13575_t
MGKPKKNGNSGKQSFNPSKSSTNPDRAKPDLGSKMRSKATVKRLKMYKSGKPTRDKDGKIIEAAEFQKRVKSGEVARVAPNRKWFGNTRVITQGALQTFQTEMGKVMKDPYKVVMKSSKLPLSLLQDRKKTARVHLLDTESFGNTFGPKAHRKRPALKSADLKDLVETAMKSNDMYDTEKDKDRVTEDLDDVRESARHSMFSKGQSKRIWNELFKVIDSSDVVIQVLDARDPMGTRSRHIENYMKNDKPHKHLIFVLNKCDLVPTWATRRWIAALSAEYPTLAFHASVQNPFGKGALIQLLRQFGKLHSDKKNISVGFIGYPNVGKSSIINTLMKKKVCKTAPIPGETKVWQYVTLMRRIYLVDCPGVVHPSGDTETEIVLKGVVRVENLENPSDHIDEVLKRIKPEYLARIYKVTSYADVTDFLEQVAKRSGRLLKGGEADTETVSKMILADFQRGRLPYFVPPPKPDGFEVSNQTKKIDKIEFVPATNNEKAEGDNEVAEKAQPEKRVKGVKQDLAGLHVEPDFIEEDIEGDPMDDNEDLLIDGEEEEELLSADEDDVSEDGEKETENQGDEEVNERGGGQGGDTAMLVDLTTTVEENLNSFEILQEDRDGRKIKTDKKQSKAAKKKRSADQLKKKAGGDLSFTVVASETTSSDENISEGCISKIKAKIETEDEEQILTSLTPEEKAFLGIKEDEDEDDSEEDESEDEEEEEMSDYGDEGAQNNKDQAVDAKEDEEDDEEEDTREERVKEKEGNKRSSMKDSRNVSIPTKSSQKEVVSSKVNTPRSLKGKSTQEVNYEYGSARNWTVKNDSSYKISHSPHVLCIEAVDINTDSTPRSKENREQKMKRRFSDDSDSEDEGTKRKRKEKRMTTNKKKIGVHYYQQANVKNKNKNNKTGKDKRNSNESFKSKKNRNTKKNKR